MLNDSERRVVNGMQGALPLVPRPFRTAARSLGMNEGDLIGHLRALIDAGYLSRFGPLLDAERLGGSVTLAAMRVPEHRFARVAAAINALPEVAHNYRREHELNLWFVIASECRDGVRRTLETIRATTGIEVLDLPRRRCFHLGFRLQVAEDGRVDTVAIGPASAATGVAPLADGDLGIVRLCQDGLPLVARPFAALAARLGIGEAELIGRLAAMLASGAIRRIGAVPNHYRLGLKGNGMTVWDIGDGDIEACGAEIGSLGFVSHCYERPRHGERWPYNLFAMVHGADRTAVLHRTAAIAGRIGRHCRRHDVLFSDGILKKTGLRLAV